MTGPYKRIVATTKEVLQTDISSTVSPLGTAPDWAIVPVTDTEPAADSTTWKAGSWGPGGWSARTTLAEARSGFVGALWDHVVARGTTYKVFVRWHDGQAVPVKFLGLLVVD